MSDFEDSFARRDFIGGHHSKGDILDKRVAFSECLATTLAGIISNKYFYKWNNAIESRNFASNLEIMTTTLPGWFNEVAITNLIYDIYDDPKRYNNPIEEHDNINLELKYIIDALIYPNYKESSAFTSIFSFIYSLKNLPEIKYDLTIQNKIDKLVTKYKIGQPKKK